MVRLLSKCKVRIYSVGVSRCIGKVIGLRVLGIYILYYKGNSRENMRLATVYEWLRRSPAVVAAS